ncbi:hypothetical protein [Cupriavidus sp. AU9028]|uniref:hypothetical protein n=1 Tax=Cupriavidus sp. AU9028 TaxID=2871157 RepID=UPI001C950001|nr:hypothetical protein [Cupriavidus sp. AU9028]MBY4896968.1 hypothetical protein [Cupriavidus sp. AU9028]
MTSYIEEYCARIRRGGAPAVIAQPVVVDSEGAYRMSYVPFEHTNATARLVLVSLTPGHMHVRLAAQTTETLLRSHAAERVIECENKRQVELGGPLVRPNLVRMLDHFGIPALLGLHGASALWEESFHLLQPLALLPHAATRRGLAFDGSFEEMMSVTIYRHAYQQLFLDRLARIHPEAVCIAFGRTAWAGLGHAVEQGVLKREQLLGMMPVPARAGSMVRYFLGQIAPEALSPNDPVRHRTAWLDGARQELIEAVRRRRQDGAPRGIASAAA